MTRRMRWGAVAAATVAVALAVPGIAGAVAPAPTLTSSVPPGTWTNKPPQLSWTAGTGPPPAGPVTYDLYRGQCGSGQKIYTGSGPYTDTGLGAGLAGPVSYCVRATDTGDLTTTDSSLVSVQVDTSLPGAPGTPSAKTPTNVPPSLSWAASTDAGSGVASYDVYRNGVKAGSVLAPATTFVDAAAPEGKLTYTVRALDKLGNVSNPSAAATVLYDKTVPTTPGRPSGSTPVTGSPTISWTAATDAAGVGNAPSGLVRYEIVRFDGTTQVLVGTIPIPGLLTFTDKTAPDGVLTYYVRAVDAAGNVSHLSPGRTIVVDHGGASAPTGLTGTTPTGKAPYFTWQAPRSTPFVVDHYDVYRDNRLISHAVALTTPFFTDITLRRQGAHVYAVAAASKTGAEGMRSAPFTIVYDAPPKPPGRFTVHLVRGKFVLRWSKSHDTDFRYFVVGAHRSRPPKAPGDGKIVYRGPGTSVRISIPPGQHPHFAVWAFDALGSRSLPAFASAGAPLVLYAPTPGQRVAGSPRLRWTPDRRASFYVVTVTHAGRVVFSVQVGKFATHATVPSSKLVRGVRYTWEVRVGKGAPSRHRLVRSLGTSTFRYR